MGEQYVSIAIAAIIVLIVIIIIIVSIKKASGQPRPPWIFEPPERRAGRIGELRAFDMISSVLREDDRLFANVQVSFDGKQTELDNVVVNKYGVFIIEVKNYNGSLSGGEDDYEWLKYHTTDAGNTYSKTVKNSVKQVKRQVYILSKYLDYYGARVWVSGYALLLQGNSPVNSEYILLSAKDIDRAIHTSAREKLTAKTIDVIADLLT